MSAAEAVERVRGYAGGKSYEAAYGSFGKEGPDTLRADLTALLDELDRAREALRTLDAFFDFGEPPTDENPIDIDASEGLCAAFAKALAALTGDAK